MVLDTIENEWKVQCKGVYLNRLNVMNIEKPTLTSVQAR